MLVSASVYRLAAAGDHLLSECREHNRLPIDDRARRYRAGSTWRDKRHLFLRNVVLPGSGEVELEDHRTTLAWSR